MNSDERKYAKIAILVGVLSLLATILTIQSIPSWMSNLWEKISSVPIAIKSEPTSRVTYTPNENVTIQNLGTYRLLLTEQEIAIGTADKYQDLLYQNLPPFTVFVIYGPLDEEINVFWGGWDSWENVSEDFINQKLNQKIEDVKRDHPTDWNSRGIRVIKCYGQVTNCKVMSTLP